MPRHLSEKFILPRASGGRGRYAQRTSSKTRLSLRSVRVMSPEPNTKLPLPPAREPLGNRVDALAHQIESVLKANVPRRSRNLPPGGRTKYAFIASVPTSTTLDG